MNSDPRLLCNSYPFKRPWMTQNGAAAAASGNKGLKGIIAGNKIKYLLIIILKVK